MNELCAAVEKRDLELVQKLIKTCPSVDGMDLEKRFAVNIAVGQGNIEMLKILLDAGCSVNQADGQGKYPLHEAALTDRPSSVETVLMLLNANADPDAKDKYQETPLMTACYWSNYDVIKVLAERTKDINYQTPATKRAAIHYAAMSRQKRDVVGLLLELGADASLWHDDYETPLIIATRSNGIEAVKALLKTNCCIDYQGFMDYTALHWAVYCAHTDIVSILLDNNAAVNLHNCLDRLPLHVAASCGTASCAKLLLDAGAVTERTDSNGMTPLMAAVQAGCREIARLLIYANADTENTAHHEKRTPLTIAVENTYMDIAKDLLYAGSKVHWYWVKHGRFSSHQGPEFFRNMVRNQGKMAELQNNHICAVHRLQHLCRLKIRQNLTRGMKIIEDIGKLCLPSALKDYVSFKDVLDISWT